MRIWHTDLIPVLPKQQLNGEWRELNTIFKAKKPVNHLLIYFAYDYPKAHLLAYTIKILAEMRRRGYKYNTTAMNKYFTAEDYAEAEKITVPFPNKMTERYLIQCYYNLQEKYDCGGISDEEWAKIERFAHWENTIGVSLKTLRRVIYRKAIEDCSSYGVDLDGNVVARIFTADPAVVAEQLLAEALDVAQSRIHYYDRY